MTESRNNLYPVFLKLSNLQVLIVGAGEVACEKLHFVLKSSPDAKITVVAPDIAANISKLPSEGFCVDIIQAPFEQHHLDGHDLVVAATCLHDLNLAVHGAAKARGMLINVADTPHLCDFYMGSIVTKGHLKIGISTNGQSPTFAKRFRQLLEDVLPDDIEQLLPNLRALRDQLRLDFEQKVSYLNEVTKSFIAKEQD